ncbi:MAG: hypothetical protein IT222_12015, partial [Crocinitomix sp.]|nr:hypothetical protein [Crocinitomix sp.]
YITREIQDRERLIEILFKEVTIKQFDDAISNLSSTLNLDLVGDVLNVGFLTKYFNENNEETLKKILLLNFHKSHEDITSLFQSNYHNNKENIPILLQSINTIPSYLTPDDFKYPYIRKIIYAIGAQPEPYNIEALEKLASETNDEKIKDLALHQIEKRKELGRWEAAKNAQ